MEFMILSSFFSFFFKFLSSLVQTKSISFWEAFKCCTKAAVATIGVDAQKVFCVDIYYFMVCLCLWSKVIFHKFSMSCNASYHLNKVCFGPFKKLIVMSFRVQVYRISYLIFLGFDGIVRSIMRYVIIIRSFDLKF